MTTTAPATINVTDLIDRHPLSRLQLLTLVLCFLIVAVDGFDTAAIGFIAPAIRAEWQLTPASLAPIFGAGLGGLMAGAFIVGPFADRFGRKRVLVASVAFFGLASLASAWAGDPTELMALRFLTGLGLGGAMPNAITLTSEYCPARRRSFLVMSMFCGFTIGSALGGLAAAGLIEAHGWRSVLLLGGAMPLALLPLLAAALPESVRYLVIAQRGNAPIVRILDRIAPDERNDAAHFTVDGKPGAGSPIRLLLRPELARGTVLLWLAFFMSMLVIYLLSSWLPTLLRSTGVSLTTAALMTTMFQIGGTLGAVCLGWLMDRIDPHRVLFVSYLLAALFIALIGSLASDAVLAGALVFCAGFCVVGGQVGANAVSADFYPTDCRATGVAWANGTGRLGAIAGSMGGGAFLTAGISLPTLFVVVGIPAAIGGALLLTLGAVRRQRRATAHLAAEAQPG